MAKINENAFEAGVGGASGTLNYQTPLGTHGPGVQMPSHFTSSDQNKAVNQMGNTAKKCPDPASLQKDLNKIYSKKDTPSPDEVVAGIKYELAQMIKPDKQLAKEKVIANLKKDPHHYSTLNMLNITDKAMTQNMTENKKIVPNLEEIKKIFTGAATAKDNKYVVNTQISEIIKDMWAKRQERRAVNRPA